MCLAIALQGWPSWEAQMKCVAHAIPFTVRLVTANEPVSASNKMDQLLQ